MAFNLVPLGAEVPSNRLLLAASQFEHVGLNYARLKARGLPKTKPYLIEGRFEEHLSPWVEPGNPLGFETLSFAEEYEAFVERNIHWLDSVVEFDGHPDVAGRRREFYDRLPEDKVIVVWKHTEGLTALRSLCERYERVGVPDAAIQEVTTLAGTVQRLQSEFGTRFHAMGCARPDNLRSVRFESASTLAWLSPMRRGETVVWDGTRLVRYPKAQKDQARLRHRSAWQRAGFDPDLIANDDPNEVAAATLWAYKQLEISVDKRRISNPFTVIDGGEEAETSDVPANSEDPQDGPSAEVTLSDADNRVPEVRNDFQTREPGERRHLPVFAVSTREVVEDGPDGKVIRHVPLAEGTGEALRQCNTCFVADNCPARKPNSTCAFSLPVEMKTKEQVKALLNAVVEMQAARVAFARFAEEINGGYPDPNVSQEVDRLFRLVKNQKELEENREYMRLTMERSSGAGVLSAIFGNEASMLKELPNGGMDADQTNKMIQGTIEDV